VFIPLGFMQQPEPPGPTPLPTIASPLFALDTSAPLSDHGFFPTDGKGGTPLSGYNTTTQSILDLVSIGWWDLITPATLASPVQNGLPGLRVDSINKVPYGFAGTGNEDPAGKIWIWQGSDAFGNPSGTAAPFTIFATFSLSSLPTGATVYRICSASNFDGTIADGCSIYVKSDGFYFQRAGATANLRHVAAALATGKLYAVVARFAGFGAGGMMSLAVNELAEDSLSNPIGPMESDGWSIANFMAAGFANSAQDFCDGYFFEGRVWGTSCTDAERDALLAYASGKWGS
jgi:hypothetical protein